MNNQHTKKLATQREAIEEEFDRQFNPTGETLIVRLPNEEFRIPVAPTFFDELDDLTKTGIEAEKQGDTAKFKTCRYAWRRKWEDVISSWLDNNPTLAVKIAKQPQQFVWRLVFNVNFMRANPSPEVYQAFVDTLFPSAVVRRSLTDDEVQIDVKLGIFEAHRELSKKLALEMDNLMGYLFKCIRSAQYNTQKDLKKWFLHDWRKPVSLTKHYRDTDREVEQNFNGIAERPTSGLPTPETGILWWQLGKQLNKRQYQVAVWSASGYEPKEIAEMLDPPVTAGQVRRILVVIEKVIASLNSPPGIP